MTISVAPARNEYTGNAGQTIFNFTFKIFSDTDLNVYITPTGQEANDSTDLTVAYTVLGLNDEDGGTITLTSGVNLNDLVTIVSNVPSSRTVDYQNNGDFRPDTVNTDFDTVVSIVKKIEDDTNRSLLLPQSQQGPKPLSLPNPLASAIMRWKSDLSGLENTFISELSPGVFPNDEFTLQGTLGGKRVDTTVLAGQVYIFSDRANGLFDVVSGTGTSNGLEKIAHDILSLTFELRKPNFNPIAWGAVGDGVADDKAAFENMFNTTKGSMITNDDDVYLISTQATITSVDNITLSGKGTFFSTDINGIFDFVSCDNLTITDVNFEGNQDLASWTALTPAERQQHSPLVTITTSDDLNLYNVKTLKNSGGIKLHICNNSHCENLEVTGCFGPVSGGQVVDPNFGYGYFVNGGEEHTIINAKASEIGGTVLLGLTVKGVKNFGGHGKDCHDNGFYGSSAEDGLCQGFSLINGLSNGVKFRGSNNVIQGCSINNTPSIALVLSGIPLDSNVDSQGAVGHGGGIFNCVVENCGSILRVDRVVENTANLYMRDLVISGNTGNNLTSDSLPPIEIYGIKNIDVSHNIVNTYVNLTGAFFALGESGVSPLVNASFEHNHAANGPNYFQFTNTTRCSFSDNTFESLSGANDIVSNLTNVLNCEFSRNKGDDNTKRIDIRNHLGSVCLDNDMFIQGNNNVQGESRSQGNATNPNYDVSVLIPTRIGHIVSNGSGMFIAKATAATSDWVAL